MIWLESHTHNLRTLMLYFYQRTQCHLVMVKISSMTGYRYSSVFVVLDMPTYKFITNGSQSSLFSRSPNIGQKHSVKLFHKAINVDDLNAHIVTRCYTLIAGLFVGVEHRYVLHFTTFGVCFHPGSSQLPFCSEKSCHCCMLVNEQAGLLQLVLTPPKLFEQVIGGGENVTLAVRVCALGAEDLSVYRPRPGCVGVILDGMK